MNNKIPVCEPFLNGNELKYVTDAVKTGWISSSGKYVTEFEEAFSKYCGVEYGVAVCNGTIALHLALVALGIGEGDEVIIPSFTMIATAFAVCYVGATPIFVDANKRTWNIDVNRIEEKITPRTRAIIPVHIFGNPCNMDAIVDIAKRHNIHIIEDAAEAHGAEYNGKKIGSFSSIGCFSFFANKNLTTGEGGMVVTSSKDLYDKCRYYKNMCFPLEGPRNYMHKDIGYNYRMSNIHAAIGLAQTEKADEYRNMRIKNAGLYRKYLAECNGVVFQQDEDNALNVHWMNAIVIDSEKYGHSKDEVIQCLRENGIDTRLLFVGMHKQEVLKRYGCICDEDYPVTDWLSKNGFYLPSASNISEEQIKRISEIICNFSK